jgi:hypothetical protein
MPESYEAGRVGLRKLAPREVRKAAPFVFLSPRLSLCAPIRRTQVEARQASRAAGRSSQYVLNVLGQLVVKTEEQLIDAFGYK